jgi:hypothetical protein
MRMSGEPLVMPIAQIDATAPKNFAMRDEGFGPGANARVIGRLARRMAISYLQGGRSAAGDQTLADPRSVANNRASAMLDTASGIERSF